MRISSSAPTRIDLAGGTVDIWPLYLFHEHAQTLNAAISLRAHAEISPRTDGRIRIESIDTAKTVEVAGYEDLRDERVAAPAQQAGVFFSRGQPDSSNARRISRRGGHRRILGAERGRLWRTRPVVRRRLGQRSAARHRHECRGPGHRRPDRSSGLSAGVLRRDCRHRAAARWRQARRARRRCAGTAAPARARLYRRTAFFRYQQLGNHQTPHRRRSTRVRVLRSDRGGCRAAAGSPGQGRLGRRGALPSAPNGKPASSLRRASRLR